MPKPAAAPNPLDAALAIKQGKAKLADYPRETQIAVNRLNRFSEGKVAAHAAEQRAPHRSFMPGPHLRRVRLS